MVAQLGYGDGDEATVVSYGPNVVPKYITTYFRHKFVNNSPVPFLALSLRVQRDDGVLVWLNGAESFRDNMPPSGPIAFDDLASTALGASLENTFISTNLQPNIIPPGTNVLAVEIHQGTVDSSDLSFDLELIATLAQPDPNLALSLSTGRTELRWPAIAGPFRLEQTTNLVAWSAATNPIQRDGYWSFLILTNKPGLRQQFFRLNRN